MRNRLTALLLCAAMVLSLFGCTGDPTPTQPPATDPPAPTEPPALTLYNDALSAVEAAADVTLTITATTSTAVGNETFAKSEAQTLTYTGLGTDSPAIRSANTVTYEGGNDIDYQEIFTGGTLYLDAAESYTSSATSFSAPLTAEDAAARYIPVVLLDASLYSSVTMAENDDGTLITFGAASAPEGWALPEGAELIQASGSALIDAEGVLKRLGYNIVYQYGAAKITRNITSEIALEADPIQAPADVTAYVPISHPDAVLLYHEATNYLAQADAITSSYMESSLSEAGGIIENISLAIDLYFTDSSLDAKLVTNIYGNYMGETDSYELEELFTGNKYTSAENGGEPEENSSITAGIVSSYGFDRLYDGTVHTEFWQDATLTDLGSVYLIEFTLSEETGWELSAGVCESLFGDPALLDDYATGRGIDEIGGYFAVDKYTHLPTGAGYLVDVWHTIEGTDCALTYQADQSYDAPSLSSYHNITEEYLPEVKPATPATPLFYHVTGEDGQEMWLLGTIHVGDNRTAYLPQEIYDAFAASDALALEYDSKAFDEQVEEDEELQEQISDTYYYSDGTTTADHLDAELHDTAVRYLKATGSYNMNAPYMKPYLWSSSIENFFLRQGYSLTSSQGVESRLEKLAGEQGKEVRSVESGLFQIQMLTGYSDELQEWMLSDTVGYGAMEYWQGTDELFELWCQGDEAALREELADDVSELTEEELALYNEYNDAMLVDRNAGMLDVAIGYLESGDVVFYAVGLAHLISGGNGLVDTLRGAGYTVELVTYGG